MAKVRKMMNKIVGEFAELCFPKKAASLGLVVSKPYGESMPYDIVVDNGACLNRIQVKSTAHICHNGYSVMTCRDIRRRWRVYSASEIDFLAAYVVPEDTWYLFPVGALNRHQTISLFPHIGSSRSKWEQYREAWHLLLPEPSARRIFAQADTGAWDSLSGVMNEIRDNELRDWVHSREAQGWATAPSL